MLSVPVVPKRDTNGMLEAPTFIYFDGYMVCMSKMLISISFHLYEQYSLPTYTAGVALFDETYVIHFQNSSRF